MINYTEILLYVLSWIFIVFIINKILLRIRENEYIILLQNIESIVELYKINILIPQIDKLKNEYDLTENKVSQDYQQNLLLLYCSSTKDIMNNYLSFPIRRILLKYFSKRSAYLFIYNMVIN